MIDPLAGAIVDGGEIVHVIAISVVAGVGVSLLFALTVLGISRASDLRSSARASALAYGALATLAGVGCCVLAVAGVVVLSHK